MAESKIVKNNTKDKVFSILGLVAVIVVIGGLMIASNIKKPISEEVWNDSMTMGDTESPKRHYIMYTDIMCPYCDVFTRATMNFSENFEQYLADNHILFEIRMTNMLYYSGVQFSTIAAQGAYCAADKGQFWDYYHGAIKKLWDDYHSKGIGDSKNSPHITGMTDDWWLAIAEPAKLDSEWVDCVKEKKFTAEIADATEKTWNVTNGLPYFSFNGKTFDGLPSYFETWAQLKEFLDMGL